MMDRLAMLASWAQIISVPLALIAILLSVWLYRRGKQTKRISCAFDDIVTPVEIRAGDALKGDIEIRYKGKLVDNLFVVRASLKNVGNAAIRKSDVIEPITFSFDPGTEIIKEPHIVRKAPGNLAISWSYDRHNVDNKTESVNVGFDLLNPGDYFLVEFVCTGTSQIPSVLARIEGIGQIEIVDTAREMLLQRSMNNLLTLAFLIAFMVAALILNALIPDFEIFSFFNVFTFILTAASISALFYALIRGFRLHQLAAPLSKKLNG